MDLIKLFSSISSLLVVVYIIRFNDLLTVIGWYLSCTNFMAFGFIQALESGDLAPSGVVTEGSAGSTAISLATVAPAFGCKCHVVIPDDVAIEKVFRECIFD